MTHPAIRTGAAASTTEEHVVSSHTDIVDAYMDGFRRSDKPAVLALLSDDIAWDLPGFRHLTGKADFEGEIVNPQFEENPLLVVDRTLEAGDTVVCIGEGQGRMRSGGDFRFAFCDVFTFRDDLICRVESYVVPLGGPSLAQLAEGERRHTAGRSGGSVISGRETM
jgi:uncharacterized protein